MGLTRTRTRNLKGAFKLLATQCGTQWQGGSESCEARAAPGHSRRNPPTRRGSGSPWTGSPEPRGWEPRSQLAAAATATECSGRRHSDSPGATQAGSLAQWQAQCTGSAPVTAPSRTRRLGGRSGQRPIYTSGRAPGGAESRSRPRGDCHGPPTAEHTRVATGPDG
jgi:hypothetical protein